MNGAKESNTVSAVKRYSIKRILFGLLTLFIIVLDSSALTFFIFASVHSPDVDYVVDVYAWISSVWLSIFIISAVPGLSFFFVRSDNLIKNLTISISAGALIGLIPLVNFAIHGILALMDVNILGSDRVPEIIKESTGMLIYTPFWEFVFTRFLPVILISELVFQTISLIKWKTELDFIKAATIIMSIFVLRALAAYVIL
ncbi:MAG: hypothetical protein HZC12_10160 [Nitrospirae bacterium]|nr:hypothetical protein [Nitrospirota bacterium]